MSQKTPPQATTLQNVTDWLKAVQAQHPDRIQQVTDEALLGLQALHTAVVREIMQRAVDIQEADESGKKRKVVQILQQAHEELGLEQEWKQALAFRQQEAQEQQQQQQQQQEKSCKEDGATTKMTKAQRKKARRQVDPKLLEQQELMLQQSRERAIQRKQED